MEETIKEECSLGLGIFDEKDSFGLEPADRILTEEEIENLKRDFRKQLHYYRDQEPWKVFTRSVCYQNVYEDLEMKRPLNMTDLKIQVDFDLREKDYVEQGYVGITRQMVLDEINKFEEYLPAINQHISLVWPKREAPSYNPAWMDLYSREKSDEIMRRPVTEKITFENHVYVLHRTYPEVPMKPSKSVLRFTTVKITFSMSFSPRNKNNIVK